ncbi:NADH-quinone oxidoreductase subunit 5 family protein [Imhoffiella purpurea]|nr:proton-conducting transporter membrane subunit [Imhoffiella purpurea]
MNGLIVILFLLPVVSALATQWMAPRLGRKVIRISIAGIVATFAVAALTLGLAISGMPATEVRLGGDWGARLLFDPLSSLMAFVISGISLLVHVYSIRYMAEEPGYVRFFVLLDLMTAALLLMVSAGDLITLLIAWHLIGVLLFFLLGHKIRSRSAHRYASWTLLTYRFGDLPLLIAAGLLFQAFGTWSLTDIFAALSRAPETLTLFGLPLVETVAALVALSAFARSAQFLLHTWLPYTMGGPTPVSALMHAGIVNAGGFLINRFAPLFVHTHEILHWVFFMGLVTAVIGSILMLTQNDIKKSLGYSTMGQMGFMIMECGVGAFSLAIYHLIAHGLFKGTLFLGAGGVIGDARRSDGVPKDDLYTFVVERRPARKRQPWLLMAAITLIVPVTILALAHWLVEQQVFQAQGAVVLLFFGWVTGAQLIFATYRMRTQNIWRLMGLILTSFTIVVIGYTLISHGFDLFLYPDPELRASIYAAAGIGVFWFDALVILMTLLVVLGWLATYYAERNGRLGAERLGRLWRGFYRLVASEFLVMGLYARLSDILIRLSTRLNLLLRWS